MNEERINAVWPGWNVTGTIGRGSFGCVYEIERVQFGKTEKAAMKALTIPQDESIIDELYSDGYDDESITKRLDSELQDIVKEYYLMTELKGHTNVVNCDDMQYIKKGMGWNVFIKMELLTPLYKVFRKGNGEIVSDEAVIKLGKDICQALILCEKKNIVHRDIKPQNIFRSEFGEYKLGDFGIAKTMEHTTSGTKTGTYKYMAPEVYSNKPYGHSADIYSLGLVMYWLLNENRMPFLSLPPAVPTSSMEDAARTKRFGGAKLPEPKNGNAALKKVVLKACEFEPKDRFVSAQEMACALERLSGEKDIYETAYGGVREYESTTCGNDESSDLVNRGEDISENSFSLGNEDTMGNSWNDMSETMGAASYVRKQDIRDEEETVGVDRSVIKKEGLSESSTVSKELPQGILDHVMDWKDSILEAKMRTIIGTPDREIMLSDVYHLVSLDLEGKEISSEKGRTGRINNYKALLELTQLQELVFDKKGRGASDSARKLIKSLPNLKKVSVEDTLINLDAISYSGDLGLTELVYECSMGSKLKFLKFMPCLETLKLSGVYLNPLFGSAKVQGMILGLSKLKKFCLTCSETTDVSFLASITELEELKLSLNNINNIFFLKNLTKLRILYLEEKRISDFSSLKYLSELSKLEIHDATIHDLRVFQSLTNLKELTLSDTKVSNMSFLANLPKLESLEINHYIETVDSLQQLIKLDQFVMPNLKHLSMYSQESFSVPEILDFSFVAILPELESLYIFSDMVLDVMHLKDLHKLSVLWLKGRNICNVDFLRNLPDLKTLIIDCQIIQDINVFKNFSNLKYLSVSQNGSRVFSR